MSAIMFGSAIAILIFMFWQHRVHMARLDAMQRHTDQNLQHLKAHTENNLCIQIKELKELLVTTQMPEVCPLAEERKLKPANRKPRTPEQKYLASIKAKERWAKRKELNQLSETSDNSAGLSHTA